LRDILSLVFIEFDGHRV